MSQSSLDETPVGGGEAGRGSAVADAPRPAPNVGGRVFFGRYALLTTADLAGKGLAYVGVVTVVRYFGADGYGAFSFALALVTCALTVGTFGLDLFGMRAAARHPDRIGATIPTVVGLRLLLAVTTYAGMLAAAALVPSVRAVFPVVAVLGASLLVGSVSLNWVAEGVQRVPVLGLVNVGTQALFLTLLLVLVQAWDAVWVVAVAQVGAELAVAAGVFAWARSAVPGPWRAVPRAEWRGVLAEAAPMGWTRVLRAVTLASDLAVLGFLLPLVEVGWYGGAFRLYTLFMASVGLYSVLLLSRLARCSVAGEAAVWHEVRASFRRILPPAVSATAAAAALAEVLLVNLFDPTFAAATGSLRLLLLALLVSLVSGHYRLALIALGRQGRDSVAVTAATVAHVGLKLALVPALGIAGAAVGHLLGEVCLLGVVWYYARKPAAVRPTDAPGPG